MKIPTLRLVYSLPARNGFKFYENCVFLCMDVKHCVKVGEPNHPVAAAERGEKCSLVVMQALKLLTMTLLNSAWY